MTAGAPSRLGHGPLTRELVGLADEACCWAWPDGRLHPEPPLPVAYVPLDMGAALAAGRIPWPPWEPVEAPPCGVVLDVPAADTLDGQRRVFVCCWLAGHDGDHGAVVDLAGGSSFSWGRGDG